MRNRQSTINRLMDFSLGELVRIRDWDDMMLEYGPEDSDCDSIDCACSFVEGMRPLCGMEFHIRDMDRNSGRIWFDEEALIQESAPCDWAGIWGFSADMIEHICPESPSIDLDDADIEGVM